MFIYKTSTFLDAVSESLMGKTDYVSIYLSPR